MTRALVVFESIFGNTEKVAKAIAEGLGTRMDADMAEVGSAATVLERDVGLLVVGGPTHAFGMSRKGTRESAAKQAPGGLVSSRTGLREWLDAVRPAPGLVGAAAFDTRFKKPHWLTGSAARAIQKRLRRLGFRVVASPESFFVSGTPGPLLDGEEGRARRWGAELSALLTPAGQAA